MRRPHKALTTGQAAEYCFVTADTIANWIRSGLLPAQRTAGGQYRIRIADLRTFMASRGMSTAALEGDVEDRVPCWEFRRTDPGPGADCDECIVRYLKVLDCFKLMGMRSEGDWPARDCTECEYFRRYGEPLEEGGEE
jgi:excisionase family DNA binding protein